MEIKKEDLTDEKIAAQVQAGETEAFGLLMERYDTKMLRYARKFLMNPDESEDVVQEVFVKAYINIQSFDPRRKFSPWIYRIAHNEFLNALKKRGREPVHFFDSDTIFPHPIYTDPDMKNTENREQSEAVKALLDRGLDTLDVKYREPLVLYYYQELDYQEISDIMQIPISTVGVRLRRGKEALRKAVKGDELRKEIE